MSGTTSSSRAYWHLLYLPALLLGLVAWGNLLVTIANDDEDAYRRWYWQSVVTGTAAAILFLLIYAASRGWSRALDIVLAACSAIAFGVALYAIST